MTGAGLILTVNAGSSSIKFAVFAVRGGAVAEAVAEGAATGIGAAGAQLSVRDGGGATLLAGPLAPDADEGAVLAEVLAWIEGRFAGASLIAAGHRIVHGGAHLVAPCRITPALLDELEALVPLAPLHQPFNIAPARLLARDCPGLPQFACFDTAFHADAPPLAMHYALPRALTAEGLRAYGFHGLSYEYIAGELPNHLGARAEGRVVVAHLGNGASMCAMSGRRSVATTMGFTALDGLMMGTRSGSLDPGLVLHLIARRGMSASAVEDLLYHQSGLLGVSGISNDMATLLASDAPPAREAVALFCYRISRTLGSLAAALGGIDALVFTAGIGEHAAAVRAEVCARAAWLGVVLDAAANAGGDASRISAPDSRVAVHVIATDEDRMIARHCQALLAG